MTEPYKKGDKVVVKIDTGDSRKLNIGCDVSFYNKQILGKLKDFMPKQEKIKMTVEEKKEFDELISMSPWSALVNIRPEESPVLYSSLWESDHATSNQFKFVRALEHPELIEVVKPKHEFRIGDLVEDKHNKKAIVMNVLEIVTNPVHVYYQDGRDGYWGKEDLTFIKNDVIDWGD
ncbi:hypothetical protein QS460_05010 [Liquorilactobacillus mali]|uniref:hypothetical protein n=1 Tax=Liquorilactobacillus mali TaxID=1618 RepID=UPI002650CAAC|nr:hypothetical protein [Liquorilactobacillus mali]MDN7145284.1 hypothetical protein [Liquorilactobacillus mali]